MPVIRLFLLLVVLGGLTLLLGQNWSPVLPLVFLGAKTQALPLAIWILLSVAAGALTSLFITGLFKLGNYFTRSSSRRKAAPPPRSSAQRSQARYTATSRPATKPEPKTPSNPANDWLSDSSTNDDDWGFEEDTAKTRSNSPKDVSSAAKSNYQAGSYSYSYQEPSNSGVGKTESVYDADYRVIKPPYSQPDTAENDEDVEFSAQPSVSNPAASPSKPDTDSTPNNDVDDWDSDSDSDDWDFEEDSKETPFTDTVTSNYEVNNEPKSGYRAGSVYSYSYREAKNSDLDNKFFDADRVSTPERLPNSAQDEDDWGFEDDDIGDEGDRDSDIKRR